MSLQQWFDNGWLRHHETSKNEIWDLLAIVNRDLKDTEAGLSADWRFGIAYNAALKLCSILLYAKGFKAERTLQHYRTIQAMPLILEEDRKEDAQYLDACRSKRNIAEYERVGVVTEQDFVRKVIAKGIAPDKTKVIEIMSHPVVTIEPNADLSAAAELINKTGIHKLIVVDDKCKLLGVITPRLLVSHFNDYINVITHDLYRYAPYAYFI